MSDRARELPALFRGHRVFVRSVTAAGVPLTWWTDSAGGGVIFPEAVRRCDLPTVPVQLEDGSTGVAIAPLALDPSRNVPDSPGQLVVLANPFGDVEPDVDGQLGHWWHAERTWTYDYPAGRLYLGDALGAFTDRDRHTVPLGLVTPGPDGRRAHAFATLRAEIDGEPLPLLFDTGATLRLAPDVHRVLADGEPLLRGTSFIVERVFQRWRAHHPTWLVVERGEAVYGGSLIQVPDVRLAGWNVGPVWFTTRADANFDNWRGLDTPIVGALGGSAFRYFRLVADYPKGAAVFLRE